MQAMAKTHPIEPLLFGAALRLEVRVGSVSGVEVFLPS